MKSKVCKGKSRVRPVTEESHNEQDDHFVMYSAHTVDALKSCGIRVPVSIQGTTIDMQYAAGHGGRCVAAARVYTETI